MSCRCHRNNVTMVAIVGNRWRPRQCAHGQPAPVVLAQLQASAPQLTTEDPIPLKEIAKDVAFLAIQPSDENGEHQLKGRDINHGPESISRCNGFVVC
jgi:hypothetical protein